MLRLPWVLRVIVPLLACTTAQATAQFPDALVVDGKHLPLFENPLEQAFDPKLRPKPDFFRTEGTQSTANWRGYVATWELRDERLILVKIEKEYGRKKLFSSEWIMEMRLVPLDRVFPGKRYPLPADWYDGVLRVPQGELLRYVHMGYGSMYERELLFKIEKGRVVERREIARDGDNLFRSEADLQFAELGSPPPADTPETWLDARLLVVPASQDLKRSGDRFKTRGIFFDRSGDRYVWIPPTPRTQGLELPIHRLPSGPEMPNGAHIEIDARFAAGAAGATELHVEAIRELRGGESIHAHSFPAAFEAMSAAARGSLAR